jgi:NAD(P)-dependent dehydrogenase (short-subunit alcohol dehydrogenase family)
MHARCQEWDFVLDVNLKGTFLTNQAAFPYLREGGGRIVNVTSPVALVAARDRCHYAAP